MRVFFSISIVILLSISLYFYHKIVFNNFDIQREYNVKLPVENDYVHYFFYRNPDPLYVFKKDLLDKYVVYSYENNKSGLVYANQQSIADLNYISNIQYMASFRNVFEAKFLYNEFNYIANLSPFWVHLYTFAGTIMPINRNNEDINLDEKLTIWKNTVKFGEKGIFFNCDKNKIKNILSLDDKTYFEYAYSKKGKFYEENKNPCKTMDLASILAFNYFYYLKDLENSIKFYKIAGFHSNALPGIIGMVSVVKGILGEHEKAMYAYINKINSIYKKLEDKNISEKEYDRLSSYLESNIKRLAEELNFYIISQVDKKHPECKKDYSCLEKYIKDEINKLKSDCFHNVKLVNIKSFKDLLSSSDVSVNMKNSKCFVLAYNIQHGYIKDGKLYSPLVKDGVYTYDEEKQTWWVLKK